MGDKTHSPSHKSTLDPPPNAWQGLGRERSGVGEAGRTHIRPACPGPTALSLKLSSSSQRTKDN